MTLTELMPYLIPAVILQLILMTAGLIDLIRREPSRVRGPKWAWALVCIFIGTLGPIAYFIFGRTE